MPHAGRLCSYVVTYRVEETQRRGLGGRLVPSAPFVPGVDLPLGPAQHGAPPTRLAFDPGAIRRLLAKALGLGPAGPEEQPTPPAPGAQPGAAAEPQPAPPPASFFTSDGHPIHLSAAAHDVEHHTMSGAGHGEAAELLRQVAKTLLHIGDAKLAAGDQKGALLFKHEGQQFLGIMETHAAAAKHKGAMDEHAATAAVHGRAATDLARQITHDLGGAPKEHLHLGDHERARAHPRFSEYVHHRQAELAAGEGVRHAALAAMGREGGAALPLELNRFLQLHGHGYHGLADDPEAGPLAQDPQKAGLHKSVRGNPALRSAQQKGGEARGRQKKRAHERALAGARPDQIAGPEQVEVVQKSMEQAAHHHLTRANEAYLRGDLDGMDDAVTRALEQDLAAQGTAPASAASTEPAGPGTGGEQGQASPAVPRRGDNPRDRLARGLQALRTSS